MLNGTGIRLGTASAVIDDVFGRRTCAIALLDGDTAYEWDFAGDRDRDVDGGGARRITDQVGSFNWQPPRTSTNYCRPEHGDTMTVGPFTERLHRLTYLTAERLGPREHYALEDPQLTPVVGPTGEHAASVLYSGGDLPVLDSLVVPDVPRPVSARSERAWSSSFRLRPGCGEVPRASSVALGFRTSSATDFPRPHPHWSSD